MLDSTQMFPVLPNETDSLQSLLIMLSIMRPAGAKSEKRFVKQWIAPLGTTADGFGNHWLEIKGVNDCRSRVLWSTHTDSVHYSGGTQKLAITGNLVHLHPSSKSNCLGADNAAGVWLLREMILAGVPGLYIFHRQEEIGGIGSNWIADRVKNEFAEIDFAIAFDRRGTDSVITYQTGGRTCSDAFADSLSAAIGIGHKKDETGIYTDTVNYKKLIPECTNVSVGTSNEHRENESLNLSYLFELRRRMLAFDETRLVVSRKVTDGPDLPQYKPAKAKGKTKVRDYTDYYRHEWDIDQFQTREDKATETYYGLSEIVREFPLHVADFLESQGYNSYDIVEYIRKLER